MRRSGPGGRSGRPRPAGRAERLPSRSAAAAGGADGRDNKKKKKSRAERRAARATRSSRGFFLIAGAIAAAAVGLACRAIAGARRGKRMLAHAAAQPLHFTEHARCRMACRHISSGQVRATLATGRVNLLKSELGLEPCAKIVVDAAVPGSFEGKPDTKHVEVVLSACPRDTNVVTVIDTDRDWECHCPGDD